MDSSLQQEYKTDLEENPPKAVQFLNEEQKILDGDDIYEYIFDELPKYSNMIDSTETCQIIEGLEWMQNVFKRSKYILQPEIIQKILNLMISSENVEVKILASKVVGWLLSFPSVNIEAFLQHGIIDYIMDIFPAENTLILSYQIVSHSSEARDGLIKCGFLEKLNEIANPDETYHFSMQLSAIVNLPFDNPPPEIASYLFGHFQTLICIFNEYNDDYLYSKEIINAFFALVKSCDQFLYAFMAVDMIDYFLNSECDDESYLSLLFQLLTFICNQTQKYAYSLVEKKAIEFTEKHLAVDIPEVLTNALIFLTDLMFACPETIDKVFDLEIPITLRDMLEDDETKCGNLIEVLSFAIVMMAMGSPYTYSRMHQLGYYSMIADNVNSIDGLYIKWTLRILCKGFVIGKDTENDELRFSLQANEELITWLESLRAQDSVDIAESAAYLLNKIYPNAQVPVQY
ncbi:hypothetical protein TRFO_19136 [Tritrichomonas foetus]|uniref:Uncharacterized protein n=1 Tax=Tritrichomonas foetus TaxID=1144522 RepID=A0A1J4KJ93_9EUKA|nr:hypothetical protein TRFO_19136 [Tritrichomonas foetus]|eukprot:OHT11407.1 hypothetical protein TRFO_19136 [Tritrichomonas foetus]